MFRPVLFASLVLAGMLAAGAWVTQLEVGALPPPQEAPQAQHEEVRRPDVVFVPTPEPVVEHMLKMAKVDAHDVVYDLGSGDGRLVITAAKKYGARGVGVDIDPQRIRESEANAREAGVENKVKFLRQDLFKTDIRPATVVTLYLLPELNLRLRPTLLRDLRPGTPVVSHDFDMGEWEPDDSATVQSELREHTVRLWIIPADFQGSWEWSMANGDSQDRYRLTLEQEFQRLRGRVEVNGQESSIRDGIVRGAQVSFVADNAEGRPVRFTGRLSGNTVSGSAQPDGEPQAVRWTARRTQSAAAH